jgi:hypothetical protein
MRHLRYEGSAADRAADRKAAKKAGMTMTQWEKTAADKKKDAVGQRNLDKKKKK